MRTDLPAPRAGVPAFSGLSHAWRRLTSTHHRAGRLLALTANLPAYGAYYARLHASLYGQVIVKGDPFFERKFVTPYLATFLTPAQRLTIQSHLCDLFDTAFCREAFVPNVRDGIVLWQSGADCDHQAITLRLPVRTMLEGDLTLDYRLGGDMLYRMSFAFVPGSVLGLADGQVVFIGGSQGVPGTAEKARHAARLNGEINAAAMLMIALRAICRNLDIDTICGVTAACQPVVYNEADHHLGVYDRLWDLHHGEVHNGFHVMPVACRTDTAVEGGNKSRTRRKRRLKQTLTEEMTQAFRIYVAPASYGMAAE